MTKEEIAKQFAAIQKERGNASKARPKMVFTDPLYHKARLLEGAGVVSKDKPLPSAPLIEKARMYVKKMTGKMPSKKAIGAIAAGMATGYAGSKAMNKQGESLTMDHNDIQKEAFMAAAKSLASMALKKVDKGVRVVGKKVGAGGKAIANKAKPGSTKGKIDLRTKKMQRAVGGGTLAAGMGGAMAMTGDEEKKAEAIFAKLSGYTEHGKSREEARALGLSQMADDMSEADKKNPGTAIAKMPMTLSPIENAILKLKAKKQAYKSSKDGMGNIKSHIPFVGMGSAGQKELDKLKKKKSK